MPFQSQSSLGGSNGLNSSSMFEVDKRHLCKGVALFSIQCNKNMYYDGEKVTGIIHGLVHRKIHASHVTTTLSCEYCYNGHYGSYELKTLKSTSIKVWSGTVLNPGTYEFPFSIEIPPNLPPSLETMGTSSNGLPVHYVRWRINTNCMHAEGGDTFLSSIIFHKGITNNPQSAPLPSFAYANTPDRNRYLFSQLEKDTFVRGEAIPVHVAVQNTSSNPQTNYVTQITAGAVQIRLLASPGSTHDATQHMLDEAEVTLQPPKLDSSLVQEKFIILPAPSDNDKHVVVARGPIDVLGTEDTDNQLLMSGNGGGRVGLAASTMYKDPVQESGVCIVISYTMKVSCTYRDGSVLTTSIPFRLVDEVSPGKDINGALGVNSETLEKATVLPSFEDKSAETVTLHTVY